MAKDIRNDVGPNIKYYRNKMGITQEELSILLYNEGIIIDRTLLTKIENQTRRIYDIQVRVCAKVLRVEIGDLYDDFSE